MKDYSKETLRPFMGVLSPLEAMSYSSTVSGEAWKQLAIVLIEESADVAHARRIIDSFMRQPRYDDKGQLRTDVPAAIELRMYARAVPKTAVTSLAPSACDECSDAPGWRLRVVNGYDVREICVCPRGQWQKAANRARNDAPPPRVTNRGLSDVSEFAKNFDE